MSERSTVLLEHHLKELKLPTFLLERLRGYTDCTGTRCARCSSTRYLQGINETDRLVDRSWTHTRA